MASGLCCGFSSLAAGLAIGIVGDAGVRANAQQDKIFVGMILILIFGEALALYGLIVSLILSSSWMIIKLSSNMLNIYQVKLMANKIHEYSGINMLNDDDCEFLEC